MQLPENFPHTRREQYLVALPAELQSDQELRSAITVLRRLRRFNDRLTLRYVRRLQEAGWPDEELVRLLTAETETAVRTQRWRLGPLGRR